MLILGLHTAGPACEVALLKDGQTLAERREAMMRGQDARLPGLVEEVCADGDVTLQAIDRFGVVTGPGSFTGVRVGIAFARGLSLATGKPALGITTLEAALPEGQQGSALVALPAQKRPPDITYWTQSFRSGLATGPAEEMALEALAERLSAHPHMVYGDAQALAERMSELKVHTAKPTARRAAELAALFDPENHPPKPTYARAPDAALPGQRS